MRLVIQFEDDWFGRKDLGFEWNLSYPDEVYEAAGMSRKELYWRHRIWGMAFRALDLGIFAGKDDALDHQCMYCDILSGTGKPLPPYEECVDGINEALFTPDAYSKLKGINTRNTPEMLAKIAKAWAEYKKNGQPT